MADRQVGFPEFWTVSGLSLSDMNDQLPEFTSPPEGFILENQPANTVVMAVSTRNLDEAEYFLYKIGESGGV